MATATQQTTTRPAALDVATVFDRASSQFRGLNPREPGQWPLLPKLCAWLGAVLLVLALGWLVVLSGAVDELDAARGREPALKADYRNKLAQAINLSELRRQKQQVQEYVTQIEKQLPGKAEMDALVSDINQAGIGRGLQFELFRSRCASPGATTIWARSPPMSRTCRASSRCTTCRSRCRPRTRRPGCRPARWCWTRPRAPTAT